MHPEDLVQDPGDFAKDPGDFAKDPGDLGEDPGDIAKDPSHSTRRAYTTRLWPTHCVQHTPGTKLVANLDTTKVDLVLNKGTDPRVEMYSAFYDPLRVEDSGLAGVLKEVDVNGGKGITHVYVVGLAYDYCVRASALDARAEGARLTTCIARKGEPLVLLARADLLTHA